jgi:hypothetical protein
MEKPFPETDTTHYEQHHHLVKTPDTKAPAKHNVVQTFSKY